MTRVKRLRWVFVRFEEVPCLEISSLLSGEIKVSHEARTIAASLPEKKEYPLSPEEVRLFAALPEREWVDSAEVAKDRESIKALAGLIDKRLVLDDGSSPAMIELERRAEKISGTGWYGFAALYHYMGQWNAAPPESEQVDMNSECDTVIRYGAQYRSTTNLLGPAPATFHDPSPEQPRFDLPNGDREGAFYEVLQRRKTTRCFDPQRWMSLDDLSTILRYTYGCHGVVSLTESLTVVRKTSPSGGGLHPIEAYPFLVRVEGMPSGLYHYGVQSHTLSLLTKVSEEEAEEMVDMFTAGQSYYRSANALFIMVARFYRNFWKYQRNSKAYKVILMDAAHLSQTLYLICAQLGLGAFFTGAVNDFEIERALGIDGLEQGVIGVSGCGLPRPDGKSGELPVGPFTLGVEGSG